MLAQRLQSFTFCYTAPDVCIMCVDTTTPYMQTLTLVKTSHNFLLAIKHSIHYFDLSRGNEWSQRDGSAVKRICCSCRDPGFDSQDALQPPVIPASGNLTSSFGLHRCCAHMVIYTLMQTHMHIIKKRLILYSWRTSSDRKHLLPLLLLLNLLRLDARSGQRGRE